MRVQAALTKVRNVAFAVVVVRRGVIDNRTQANEMATALSPRFSNVPVVLMEQGHRGRPRYFGRTDIVGFLAKIDFRQLPWRWWTLN